MYQELKMILKRPWKRLKMTDAIKEKNRHRCIDSTSKDDLIKYMKNNNIEFDPKMAHSKGLVIAIYLKKPVKKN